MHALFLVTVLIIFLGASVAYGGNCTSTANCTDSTTNECISNVCQCATTHFRNNADNACELSKYCVNCVGASSYCFYIFSRDLLLF